MIPLRPSVRTHSASRGLRGAPGSKALDHQQQPLLLIFLPSSRLGASPRFHRTEQSSNGRSHRASTGRQLAQSPQSEGEMDTRSEPQNRESGQCVVGLSGTGKTHVALGLGRAACQKGLSVGFVTAAALVHELMEASLQHHRAPPQTDQSGSDRRLTLRRASTGSGRLRGPARGRQRRSGTSAESGFGRSSSGS